MSFILRPWQLFFLILSGWVNRQQQEIIDFQNAQIKALMAKLGKKRTLLTDDQRRLLAVIACRERLGGMLRYYYRDAA